MQLKILFNALPDNQIIENKKYITFLFIGNGYEDRW